jgi:hypothetical protein
MPNTQRFGSKHLCIREYGQHGNYLAKKGRILPQIQGIRPAKSPFSIKALRVSAS